ncbi:MAG: efflux RND transporter permease subunit [Clostridia bacterium]|nr:efflux RND transporter permease subunit [Clostridia bacterium]
MEQEHLKTNIPELNEPMNILGKWSNFFVNRYRVVYLLILIILVLGTTSYFTLPRELQPEIVLPFGHVLTVYNGAAPEEVENLVTDEIENAVSDIEDIKSLTSYSGFGYSSVFVEFEQGVDIEEKISDIRENLSSIQSKLPDDAETPTVAKYETNNSPILIVNITGDMDLVALKSIAEDIASRLETESDVQEALIVGGLEREISIIVNPNLLFNYGISVDQIQSALSNANINFPGGNVVLDKKEYKLRTVGEFKNISEIENVVLKYNGYTPIRLKDVAIVKDGYKEIDSYSRMSVDLNSDQADTMQSISISVKKKKSADIIKTSGLINDIIKEERGTLYPEDLNVYISGDTAKYVRDQLGAVTNNAVSGLFLVLIVLFLFIGFGESLIVSTVIPLAILTALWLLKISGMTLNTITLFSLVLAVGMLVDNGIVIMENIDRLRYKGLNAKEAAIVGTNQIAPAVFSSMLTTTAAFFPIVLTSGIMGAFIKPIPITVIYALVASFVMAITITPALCAIVLKRHRSEVITENPKFKKFKVLFSVIFIALLALLAFRDDGQIGILSGVFAVIFGAMMLFKQLRGDKKAEEIEFIQTYAKFLHSIISSKAKRRIAIGLTVLAFFLSLALPFTGLLKVNMFSSEDSDRLYIDVKTPVGTTIDITNRMVEDVEKQLLDIPEIESFVANVGITGADSFDMGGNNGTNPTIGRIILDLSWPKDRNRTSMEVAEELRERVKNIPGGEITVTELENGPPQEAPIVVRIMGTDLEALKEVTAHYEQTLKNMNGTRKVSSSVSRGDMELQVIVDKLKASQYGISDIQVAMAVRNAVTGLEATSMRSNQDDIDIVIRTSEAKLNQKTDLNNIYVYSMSGQPIRLSSIASIKEVEGLSSIQHEDLKRRMSVTAELQNGFNASVLTNEFKTLVSDYELPSGISIVYGGEIGDIQDSFTEMFRNMLVAVILVYMILAVQFNSLSQPGIILFTVPMAIIGVMPGLLLTGNQFGFVAFIGIVSLVGIAVNDAIVLVDYINYLRRNGYELYDAVKETGISRFIPVMATTITTAGGILPLSMKEKFFQPLGVALIFGLLTATVLTLIIIPTMYTILEEHKIRKNEKRQRKLLNKTGGNNDVKETTPAAL